MTIGVLVVDDQPLFCAGIGRLLDAEQDIAYLGAAHNGTDAITITRRLQPDVVLMDLRMPDGNGITATRTITRRDPSTRVLVLTTFRDHHAVDQALQAGASGFITKDTTPEALADAIRAVAAGRSLIASAERTPMFADPIPLPTPDLNAIDDLTPREREIYLHAARGLTNPQIAKLTHVSDNTVRSHISAILRKLDLTSRNQLPFHAQNHALLPS